MGFYSKYIGISLQFTANQRLSDVLGGIKMKYWSD